MEHSHFLDFLERQLQAWRCRQSSAELPFDFTGGFVGYLGYELKAECAAPGRHISPHPDAAMFLTDRSAALWTNTGHDAVLPASPILMPLLHWQWHLRSFQLCMCWT